MATKGKTYSGWIVFVYTSWGDIWPLDYDFKGLDNSPRLFEAVADFINGFIDNHLDEQGTIWKFEGQVKDYEFTGLISEIKWRPK